MHIIRQRAIKVESTIRAYGRFQVVQYACVSMCMSFEMT